MKREDPRTTKAREQYLGKEFDFNNGNKDIKMKVIEFEDYSRVTVQVGDTDIYITTNMSNIRNGSLRNPFKENSPIGFIDPKYEYLNCLFRTNQGYLVRILNCEDREHTVYEFVDNGYQDNTKLYNILIGNVRNPFHINEFGGYLGTDKTYRHKKFKWLYTIWTTLLIRGGEGNREYYSKYHTGVHAYDDVMFDERWYCYSMFAQWYMFYYNQLNPEFKYGIDKDLKFPQYSKFTNGRKHYGPDTCLLIPQELNNMIEAADVRANLENDNVTLPPDHPLKVTANFYRDNNGLLDEAYDIIMRI